MQTTASLRAPQAGPSGEPTAGDTGKRGSGRTGQLIGIALVLIVAAAAIGRFLTASGSAPVGSPTGARPASALDALIAATQADPSDPTNWHQLATAYVAEGAVTGDPSVYALAEQAIREAERLAPGDPAVVVARSGLSVALHEFATAWTQISTLDRATLSAEGLAVAIDAATETGRYDEAVSLTQQLLDRRPDATALARASYQRELRGDLSGALDLMTAAERAAGTDRQRAALAALTGEIQLALGNPDDAVASYGRALSIEPDLLTAQVGQARSLAAIGEQERALSLTTALIERSPQAAVAVLHGELLEQAGRTDEAADAFELAAAADTALAAGGVVVELESALFQADHGDPALALEFAEAAYAARRTVFTADALAWARYVNGDVTGAVALVDEATALGTTSSALRLHAAVISDAAGDPAAARRHLEVAFDGSPWNAIAARSEAVALAERLGVAVPAAWQG